METGTNRCKRRPLGGHIFLFFCVYLIKRERQGISLFLPFPFPFLPLTPLSFIVIIYYLMMTDARVEMDEVTLRSIDLKKETDRLTTRSLPPPPPNLPTTTLFLFSTLDGHAHFRFFFITYHYERVIFILSSSSSSSFRFVVVVVIPDG